MRVPAALAALLIVIALAGCTPAGADAEPDRTPVASPASTDEAADADPWTDVFAARAADLGDSASGVSWGSFGAADAVSSTGLTMASVPPGDHIVDVECDGAEAVTVGIAAGESGAEGTDADVHELACAGGAKYPITTEIDGISITIDSHGQQGAYLVAVDVAP